MSDRRHVRTALLAPLLILVLGLATVGLVDSAARGRPIEAALVLVETVLAVFALALLASLVPREHLLRTSPPPARVAILLPLARESPDVLAQTLAGVARLTWKDRETWVLHDTNDPAERDAVRAVAAAAGARYVHRSDARGYKAGALNDALRDVTAPYVLVLDVDHVPERDIVERLLERFVDSRTAFVQGKLGWRNADSPFRRLAGLLQLQFYEVLEREKEKRGTVVFAGSAALFHRARLLDAGGFPEDTLVEDFDVTLSLAARGYRGRFADAVVARGVLPWSAADQVRQLWRWSCGTTRILLLRGRAFARSPAPAAVRGELLLDASAYLGAGLVPLAGALLVAVALGGAPLGRATTALALLVPALLLAAHAGGALVSLRRAGARGGWGLVLAYHVVSVAFTPVLLASSLFALVGRVGTHGRIAKRPTEATTAGAGTLLASGATFLFGVGLLAASGALFAGGSGAWIWAGELGLAFLLPLGLVLARPGRVAEVAPS